MTAWELLEHNCFSDPEISYFELRFCREAGRYTCDIVAEKPFKIDLSCDGFSAEASVDAAFAAVEAARKAYATSER